MNNKNRYPTKAMLVIRVAIGVYLLYQSYQLYRDRAEGSIPIWELAVILTLFVAASIFSIVYSAYLYLKGMYAGGPADIEVEGGNENEGSRDTLEDKIPNTDDAIDGTFREVEEKTEE